MLSKLLKEFLENHHVKYHCIEHSPSYTAQEIAAAAHISGKQMAKIVIIKVDGQLAMVVLPANHHVNFTLLKKMTGSDKVDLARESEFKTKFPECEVGAMPPFGNLYHMPVFVSNHLSHGKIVFNAGTHSELLQMAYDDFERLVKPTIITAH